MSGVLYVMTHGYQLYQSNVPSTGTTGAKCGHCSKLMRNWGQDPFGLMAGKPTNVAG